MKRTHFGVILGSILLLIIAMGISRFAFTPLLPYMREDESLSFNEGGMLASANYVGYFVGALSGGFIKRLKKELTFIVVSVNILSFFLMGISVSFEFWIILRFIAGLTGGIIFVLTSSIVMDYLASHAATRWSGYLFSGIGIGIAISGLFVPLFETHIHWEGTWIVLSALSTLFLVCTYLLWRPINIKPSKQYQVEATPSIWHGFTIWLIIAYGLEGLGYIVTGTFLVDIIYNIDELQSIASFSWVIVGLAAIPSAPIWMAFMNRFSPFSMMIVAYMLQVIGIALPVVSQQIWSVLLSAFLYGCTFVGLVTLTTSYGRELYPKQSAKIVSILTTFYAFGQIIGPIIASNIEQSYQTYKAPLLFASGVVLCALIILIIGKIITNEKTLHSTQTLGDDINGSN